MKKVGLSGFAWLFGAYNHGKVYQERSWERFELGEDQKEQLKAKGQPVDGEHRFQKNYLLKSSDFGDKELFNVLFDTLVDLQDQDLQLEVLSDKTSTNYDTAFIQLQHSLNENFPHTLQSHFKE